MHRSRAIRLLLIVLVLSSALFNQAPQVTFASAYNSVSFRGRADSGGVTTILIVPCGTGTKLQLRSERPGAWISEVFNRNGDPACQDAWQIVFRAPSNDNGIYIIYSYLGDAYLAEADFMQRAWRHQCQITGHGAAVCTPLPEQSAPRMSLDAPADGQNIRDNLTLSGWAADSAARVGTGVDLVEATLTAGGTEFNLGAVSYVLSRGDVAAALGDSRFTNTGYHLTANLASLGVPAGPAMLTVRARSVITGVWSEVSRSISIEDGGPPVGLCSSGQYFAQYFNNRELSGTPVHSACEDAIDNVWGIAGPGNGVASTNFSVRWEKTEDLTAGEYTFLARFDDGYRLWFDDTLLIDRWQDQAPEWYQVPVAITKGEHTIKVEYYNGLQESVAQLRYLPTPTLDSIEPNTKVANAEAVPVIIRGEHFQNPARVTINGIPLTDVTAIDATTITGVVPPTISAPGTYDVEVEVAGYRMMLPRAFSVTAPVEPAHVRAMFVLACDNDLVEECRSIVDSLEAALARSTDLQIVLLWDGPLEGDSAYYRLRANTIPGWDPSQYNEGDDRLSKGELDTGSYHTLAAFAGWAQAKVPGHYKLLNLYGHGGGWAPQLHPGQPSGGRIGVKSIESDIGGMLWDNNPESTLATVPMKKALEAITNAYDLDLLYLDACLMSMVEIHSELAPYAHYIMGHENLTWADTDAYEEFFAGISATTTPREFVEHVVEVSRTAWPQALHPNHLAVVDTTGMSQVQEQLDLLAGALIAGLPAQRPAIGAAALATARVAANNDYQITPEDPYIDAQDFALRLINQPDISAHIKAHARGLIAALSDATIVNERLSGSVHDTDFVWELDRLGGQSLFFPSQVDDWRRRAYNVDNLPVFAGNTRWDEFVNAWYANQPLLPVPTERCDSCLPVPLRIGLAIDGPEFIKLDHTVLVPVTLHGIVPGDHLHGLQIEVETSDAQIVAPDAKGSPKLGPVFPGNSLRQIVAGPTSWSYIINTPAHAATPVAEGGVVVSLPFHAGSEGCATLRFKAHKLSSLSPSSITHQAFEDRICVREKALVSGSVFLEERAPGQYGGARVAIYRGSKLAYETTTDDQGYFAFPKVDEGVYTLSVSNALYVEARRQARVTELALVDMGRVGLWAGDMDENQQVDTGDWFICAAASIPVSDPHFDINLDGITDIGDCSIVRRNIGRRDMSRTNPPESPLAGVLRSEQEEFSLTRPNPAMLPSSQPEARAPSAVRLEGGALIVESSELQGIAAVGLRLRLQVGAEAGAVTGLGSFEGQFLSSHQQGDRLYIVAALPAGATAGDAASIVRIEGVDSVVVEAINLVRPEAGYSQQLYLPILRR